MNRNQNQPHFEDLNTDQEYLSKLMFLNRLYTTKGLSFSECGLVFVWGFMWLCMTLGLSHHECRLESVTRSLCKIGSTSLNGSEPICVTLDLLLCDCKPAFM